jgi:hypothetical protein
MRPRVRRSLPSCFSITWLSVAFPIFQAFADVTKNGNFSIELGASHFGIPTASLPPRLIQFALKSYFGKCVIVQAKPVTAHAGIFFVIIRCKFERSLDDKRKGGRDVQGIVAKGFSISTHLTV